ncbi:MAG: RNA polymerase sigma-70 factor [Bacteroidetes bacterium]|nr:RNA polymerase sigma-70 factor [Fibrella sp.]
MNDKDEQLRNWLGQLARQNDQRAFRLLFERFYPELMRFAVFYVKSRETAEEIVQDVFLKIWQMRATLFLIANVRAYLFSATRNHCLNRLQKNKPVFIHFDDASVSDTAGDDDNPQQQLEFRETQRSVEAAVEALPPQCRLIFQLVKEQGFSYREVADLLSLSPRTIETQIGIALRKLAATLRFLSES